MKQTGLFSRVVEAIRRVPPKKSRNWKFGRSLPKSVGGEQCVSSCYYAKGERCECRCHGKFHGLGNNSGRTGQMDEYVDGEREEA